MRWRGSAFLLLLLASTAVLPTSACAHPITRLLVSGNEHLPTRKIVEAVTLASDNPLGRDFTNRSELLLAVEHLQEIVADYYHHEGYLYAKVDSFQLGLTVPVDSAQGYTVTLFVREGAQYRIRRLEIYGNTLFTRELLLARFDTRAGDVLDERMLQSDIAQTLRDYEHRGYPFAKIVIASITPSVDSAGAGHLDLKLEVEEGRRARIGKIVVLGNTSTDAAVITRELRLTPGALYDAEEIERARARVERLGFFEAVSAPELYLQNDSTVALILRVREASTSAIDGVLGYNPARTSSESGYISGILNLSFRNISGTGRNASLNYTRETRESQTLEVRYLEPWIFGYPFNLSASFLQREQDSTYTRTATTADISFILSQDLRLTGSLAYERVIPTDLPALPFSVYDSRTITTGLSASTDTRDNAIAPTYGVLGVLGASYGVKSIYGPTRFLDSTTPPSVGLRTLFLDASGYHTVLTERIVGAVGLHARSVTSFGGLLDRSDLFRIGGVYSIRGYREAELLASRYAYTNLEMRFMTSRLSFLFGFFDAGYLFTDSTKTDATEQVQYPLSYGIGAQVESPIGVVSVSVGLAKGEPLDQAKFHFGLVRQF